MRQSRAGPLIIVSIFVMQAALAGVAAAAAPMRAPTMSANSPSFNETWWDEYHPTGDVYDLIEKIAAEHSNIVALQTIGTTYEGRRLLVAKVSDNPNSDEADEPKYLVIAGTHAREWTTYHSAAYFLNYLTGHYRADEDGDPVYAPAGSADNDSYVTWLVNNREIYILVMVNPDGIEYSHTTEALWRKNREPNVGFVGLTCTGTDINRNFGYHWGEVQGDSHYACSDIYAGPYTFRTDGIGTVRGWRPGDPNPGGFSTAEASAIRDLQTKVRFATAMSQHSFSGLVLYPWGYTGDPAPDYVYFRQMAEKMANWTGYAPQAGYDLYKVSGEWGDWSYAVGGAYSFTIEMGNEFQPPPAEIINQSKLLLSSQLFLGETADDLHMTAPVVTVSAEPSAVVDPNTPQPVRAQIEAVNGLDAGEVVIVYSQNGGRTWLTSPMQPSDDGMTYTGQLPGLAPGVEAMYYVRATDNDGIVRSGPFAAPYSAYFVTARNGVFEQIGTIGLIAILIGAGAAGVLVYFRFIRGRDLSFKFPALPSVRGLRLPRRQAQPAAAAAASPAPARARVKPAPTINGPANLADAKRAKDTPDFDSYVASRPRLQQFLDDDGV